jgi:beta-phosphoglucomutase family hydrolase
MHNAWATLFTQQQGMNNKHFFLFDLNGTMVDDMDYHITAWHQVFNDWEAAISWEKMKEECYGKNEEIVERIFPGRFSDEQVKQMSLQKEERYKLNYKPHLALLPGLEQFLAEAHVQEIEMAIGSAAIMSNIDFVVDNLELRPYFSVIVSADEVQQSKPAPETYLSCAEKLGALSEQCIVFEDSTKGVQSALNAGMKCVALTTLHEEAEFEEYSNILLIIKDYTDKRLEELFK